ncbi:hypothetical protein F4780DRAFT_238674 [Xylariomycetidae sp. FL0641]|nr:hypothetical protein F4780DRAFT_238674 [Xylariomycetidae sp. FL0641]
MCSARTWSPSRCSVCHHLLCEECVCEVQEGIQGAHADFTHYPSRIIRHDRARYVEPSGQPGGQTPRTHGVTRHAGATEHTHVLQHQSAGSEHNSARGAGHGQTSHYILPETPAPGSSFAKEWAELSLHQPAWSVKRSPFLTADRAVQHQSHGHQVTVESVTRVECEDAIPESSRQKPSAHEPTTHHGVYKNESGHQCQVVEESPTTVYRRQSLEVRPRAELVDQESNEYTAHRHHSADFHGPHHIAEHLAKAVGHDVLRLTNKHTIQSGHQLSSSKSTDSIRQARNGHPKQLLPLTPVQPSTAIAPFQYVQAVEPPGHPTHGRGHSNGHSADPVDSGHYVHSAETSADQSRRLDDTHLDEHRVRSHHYAAADDTTSGVHGEDRQYRHDQQHGNTSSSEYLHQIVHDEVEQQIAATRSEHVTNQHANEPAAGEDHDVGKLRIAEHESEHDAGRGEVPKNRVMSPPEWLRFPSKQAADATARLHHIDTRSHETLEHRYGYLSNVQVQDSKGGILTRSWRSIPQLRPSQDTHSESQPQKASSQHENSSEQFRR